MKFNKKILKIVRDLDNLGVDWEDRRDLVKGCYGCIGLMFGFDKHLTYNISEAHKKGLNGREAYNFLKRKLKDYDIDLATSFMQKETSYNPYN
jgi:hypothetical protein